MGGRDRGNGRAREREKLDFADKTQALARVYTRHTYINHTRYAGSDASSMGACSWAAAVLELIDSCDDSQC